MRWEDYVFLLTTNIEDEMTFSKGGTEWKSKL